VTQVFFHADVAGVDNKFAAIVQVNQASAQRRSL
jgi:hypothetical protein